MLFLVAKCIEQQRDENFRNKYESNMTAIRLLKYNSIRVKLLRSCALSLSSYCVRQS